MSVNWIGAWTISRRSIGRLMRSPTQTVIAPLVSALLFVFIFGYVVGGRISSIGGHTYLEFVLPGIMMMNIINSAFMEGSTQIYFPRYNKFIQEMLVAPLTYIEMLAGGIVIVIARSLVTAFGILAIGALFGVATIDRIGEFLLWVVMISVIFGFVGMLVGLLANTFEQLNIVTIFVITPLSFVGGVFNTVAMLPEGLRWIAYANPFFYFVSGLRHAMIGFEEAPLELGLAISLTIMVGLGLMLWRLFSIGYGIRE